MNKLLTMNKQRGAALVVGMLLLLVLTLLAISGMNTASVELVMAGNTQYQQLAFQNAESAIAESLVSGAFNPDRSETPDPTSISSVAIRPQNDGDAMPGFWGSSWDDFSTFHFEMTISGMSARDARFDVVQGVAVLGPADSKWGPGSGMPSSLTPTPN
jgi:type IV pilus assembly protein PilX